MGRRTSKYLGLLVCFLFGLQAMGQDLDFVIQERLEYVSQQSENENIDMLGQEEIFRHYLKYKISLDKDFVEELEALALLNGPQIKELKDHIVKSGSLLSLYELQSLKLWSMNDINRVLPFIRVNRDFVNRAIKIKDLFKYANKELYLRSKGFAQRKRAYSEDLSNKASAYKGVGMGFYSRFRINYMNDFSFGFTLDNDAGELISGNRMVDFFSGHALISNRGCLETLVLGDYQLQLGQGLVMWTGFANGKSFDVTSIKKTGRKIRANTSANENRYLRGIAGNFKFKNFQLLSFVSSKRISARLNKGRDTATSLPLSGYHRNESELSTRKQLRESILGIQLGFEQDFFSIHFNQVYQRYSLPYYRPVKLYNFHYYRGQELFNSSVDFDWVFKNFNLFGEFAYGSHKNSMAVIVGAVFALNAHLNLSFSSRNYSNSYHSFYNSPFGENTNTNNEKGNFFVMNYKNASHAIRAYVDLFRFPWSKYQIAAPSNGREFQFFYQYNFSKKNFIYLRYKFKEKAKSFRDEVSDVKQIRYGSQQNTRLHLQWKVAKGVTWKSRVEHTRVSGWGKAEREGVLLIQDINYRPMDFPLDISLRYAMFKTEDYDSRIYSYENNALYVYSIPAYYGIGSRAYLVLRWKLNSRLDFWAKIGQSFYPNQKTIGSGLEEINGNKKTDLTFQMKLHF